MTNLSGAQSGHIISLFFANANTTLMHAANGSNGAFQLRGAANYNPPANSVLTFMCAGTSWYESVR